MSVGSNLADFPADDRPRADAVATLSGPAALAMLAGGDFPSFPPEIMTLSPLVMRIAEIEGTTFAVALEDVPTRTARLFRAHRNAILKVAHHLARRGSVVPSYPPIASVLATVRAVSTDTLPPAPEEEQKLARLIAGAPIDLAAFAREIARPAMRIA